MNVIQQVGPQLGRTIKQWIGKIALSATVTVTINLETVPAGKVLYITDIDLVYDSNALVDTRLQASGVDCFRTIPPKAVPGLVSAIPIAAGQTLSILLPVTATPPNLYFNVMGYEQAG